MRSFVRLRARVVRHGLGAMLLAATTLTTACDWITGVPTVKRVELGIAPSTSLPVGAQGQANGVAIGKNDAPITTTKVKVAYSTSNPAVATVNQTSGAIIAVSEGTTDITASSRGKSAKVTLTVTPELVTRVTPVTPSMSVPVGGAPQKLDLQLFGASGRALSNRAVTITSGAPLIASVAGTNTSNIVVTGVSIGATTLTGNVEGVPFSVTVNVTAVPATRMDLALQKGGSRLLIGESTQLVATFKDAAGNTVSPVGRNLVYSLSDQTIATITGAGVVTGLRLGTTQITVTEQGTGLQGKFDLTVDAVPAKDLIYAINPVFRKGAPRVASAVVLDSALNPINRAVAYTSSNPSVITINPTSGLATPNAVGTATLTAKVDNLSQSIAVRVTVLPIQSIVVSPPTQTVFPGETVQYTAQITDSLNGAVTDRFPTWSSSSTAVAQINASTGLATAQGPGGATITALMERVPSEGNVFSSAQLTVNPTRVDSISVSNASLTIKSGTNTAVTIVPRDAAGNQLFGRTIIATPQDASIAIVNSNNGTTLVITGISAGTTKITLQAVNSSGVPEGKPSVINVTVN